MEFELDGVSVMRDGNWILKDINFGGSSGEHWVILGPNGAGKTTLISLIAGRNYPTRGSVRILGEKLGKTEVADLHLQVGLSSSVLERIIDPQQRVSDVVLSAAYGTTRVVIRQIYEDQDRQRARDLMHLFSVDGLQNRPIVSLSDGERQRVMICRALMSDPEILILDEPAAGVDMGARELLMQALDELASDPRSPILLLVTHHVEEIPSRFTHALLLKQGRIIHAGVISDVLTAQNLSETFDMPLQSGRFPSGRWWAQAERAI
ncbi:MAG: ATP-binding cassette domain-containing protein [Varibaculum sp.]|nr:ATP-binding cassette domain-containing protein [Varibaculum sp.]